MAITIEERCLIHQSLSSGSMVRILISISKCTMRLRCSLAMSRLDGIVLLC